MPKEYMDDITKIIYELELSLLKPEVRFSSDQLNLLLADDFQEFGSSGLVYDKKVILERLPENLERAVYNVSDFSVKVLSDDIVLTTFKTEKVTNDADKVFCLRSSLWRKTSGSWQMFFHQGTPIE